MLPLVRHLYLHVPFCAKVCPYCAFYVHGGSAGLQRRYVAAVCKEIQRARSRYKLDLQTVYFGGGTPSMLSVDLFVAIAQALPSNQVVEFTLEVNPATVTRAKADAWKAAGVNRISLGAQSFDADYLKLLGRQHVPEDISETVRHLRETGFENINIDLMYSLPMMPEETWERTLKAALDCGPNHVSAYALTYEEDTPFYEKLKRGAWKTDEEREIRMFNITYDLLREAGFDAYEVSNFARPGFESIHNLSYWRGEDYLGIGPSACSTVAGQRWKNFEDTEAYIVRIDREECLRTEIENLTPEIRRREKIMLGLRTREGVEIDCLGDQGDEICQLVRDKLAVVRDGRLTLTQRGRIVADSITEMFC
jgi:oxygen-independent coproporphyrinogen III oxidase